MAKAFSIEDGSLASRPITTTTNRTYLDIDCSMEDRPDGDVYLKKDAAAVKQAVKNLLMTRQGEAPFQPLKGTTLNEMLFSLDTEFDEEDLEMVIKAAVKNHEPRANVIRVHVKNSPDYNSADVTVVFSLASTQETVSVNVTVMRVR